VGGVPGGAEGRLTGRVVVDTNVFTAWLRGSGSPLALQYVNHLVGQQVAVSPQTVAEARYGALNAGWGPRRLREVEQMTNRVRVLDVDGETIEAVAQLRNQCRLIGHALHQRLHNADLWIAAAAIRWALPLVAHDGVFIGCPGLDLRTELTG
jgi:predicted nucleic acid-binding protein